METAAVESAPPATTNGADVAPNGTNGVSVQTQAEPTPEPEPARASGIQDTVIENTRPLRVVVIGAGFAGILAAIRCVFSTEANTSRVAPVQRGLRCADQS
jgi:hypothetical protein